MCMHRCLAMLNNTKGQTAQLANLCIAIHSRNRQTRSVSHVMLGLNLEQTT